MTFGRKRARRGSPFTLSTSSCRDKGVHGLSQSLDSAQDTPEQVGAEAGLGTAGHLELEAAEHEQEHAG